MRLIGTELYQRLWARALRRVRGDAPADGPQVELHLGTPFAIPADYVPEPDVRIALYRRLSTITGEAEVEVLAEEVADRFGPPPDAVRHLIGLAQLRQRCVGLEIARLEAGPKGIALEFREPAAARARLHAVTADAGLEWAGQPCRISSLW